MPKNLKTIITIVLYPSCPIPARLVNYSSQILILFWNVTSNTKVNTILRVYKKVKKVKLAFFPTALFNCQFVDVGSSVENVYLI